MMRKLIFAMLIMCGLLLGCTPVSEEKAADPQPQAASITEIPDETDSLPIEEIPDESAPLPTLDIAIETIPQPIDDSDYQLPPGERPTLEPQIS